MKKLLLAAVVVLAMALATVGVAFADGGPHGGYTPTTDACAGCHRAHTAAGPRLLVQASVYDLCVSCHGNGGTGANTDVENGFYLASRDDAPGGANGDVGAANTPDNAPLLGGGFVNYGGAAVTSIHDVDPASAATTDMAWGDGVNRGVASPLAAGVLSCTSCHDPHGNYGDMSDVCAACHRIHTGSGASILYSSAQDNAFCYTCHDGTGAPATPIVSSHSNSSNSRFGFRLDMCKHCDYT